MCAAKKIDIDENCLDLDKTTKEETRRRYTAPIATFTTLFGGVVGYVGRERWSRVPLRDAPRRVGLTIEHGDGHQEIGLAIAF